MKLLDRSGASRSLKWRACPNFMLAALFLIALAPQMARATEAALAAKAADVSRLDAAIAEQGAVRVLVELSGIAHPAGAYPRWSNTARAWQPYKTHCCTICQAATARPSKLGTCAS